MSEYKVTPCSEPFHQWLDRRNAPQPQAMRQQLIEALDYFIHMGMDEELQEILAARYIGAMGK